MRAILTINAIINYIEDNIDNHVITIHHLVLYSGYCRRHLQSLFKKQTGIPIGKYIQYRRISRAAVYLKFTNISIVSISNKLYYDSQQTFSREFKKITGFSPGNYRMNTAWSFPKMTGARYVHHAHPSPVLLKKKNYNIPCEKITYIEKIPFTGKHSEQKWSKVLLYLQKQKNITLSHFFAKNKIQKNTFNIDMYIWNKNIEKCEYVFVDGGTFARFSYTGCIRGYITFINYIYMNTMAIYNLQPRYSLDIEIITRINDSEFNFEYFLPIYRTDNN